jgi:hypothetical protein
MNATEARTEVTTDPVTNPEHAFCGYCYPFETTIVRDDSVLIAVCGVEVQGSDIAEAASGPIEAMTPPANACAYCMVADHCTRGHHG